MSGHNLVGQFRNYMATFGFLGFSSINLAAMDTAGALRSEDSPAAHGTWLSNGEPGYLRGGIPQCGTGNPGIPYGMAN